MFSRLEEEPPADCLTMALDHRDEEVRPRQRGLISRIKDAGELAKYDKEVCVWVVCRRAGCIRPGSGG